MKSGFKETVDDDWRLLKILLTWKQETGRILDQNVVSITNWDENNGTNEPKK